jgi:glucose-6-phosphate isomerase
MITSLKKISGLNIKLDTVSPGILFGDGLHFSRPGVRTILQMREVLLDKGLTVPEELYYMYRDVYVIADEKILKKNKLRYDITVIKPGLLGEELMKTAGHYHPGSFTEVYELLNGQCLCLLQRPNIKDHRIIEEVIAVEAVAGDKIVIPPGFGHILVNTGSKLLVTDNWVSSEFSSEYGLYQKAQGAAYFIKNLDGVLKFVPNDYFLKNAVIRRVRPAKNIGDFGLAFGKPIYPLIEEATERLAFLNHPLDFDYGDIFSKTKGAHR